MKAFASVLVLPLTIIEAMASGLPVIGIESPGINDLIQHGKTGVLTGIQDGDLARGILSLTRDPGERGRLAHNGSQASHQYHISHTVGQTVRLYERLLGRHSLEEADQGQDEENTLWENHGSIDYQGPTYEVVSDRE